MLNEDKQSFSANKQSLRSSPDGHRDAGLKQSFSSNKPRVIIDTNLILSAAIVSKSLPDQLINTWLKGSFILVIAREQLVEIRDVSQRKKLKGYHLFPERIAEFLDNIEFAAEMVEDLSTSDLPIHTRDPDDDFLLACALEGKVDYLVTGDQDLLVLNNNPALGKLKIVSVKEFLGQKKYLTS